MSAGILVGHASSVAMSRRFEPPRVVIIRPKSAGSLRCASQASSLLAAPPSTRRGAPCTPQTPPSPATFRPPQPFRPNKNTGKRPASANASRRCFEAAASNAAPPLPRLSCIDNTVGCTWAQEELPLANSERNAGNIYYAVVARKDAEDVAKQLARRIAHFRAQEERVLREMQTMRTHLETTLTSEKQPIPPVFTTIRTHPTPNRIAPFSHPIHLQSRHTTAPDTYARPPTRQTEPLAATQSKRKPKAPRSREQLQFLAKQKQALEAHKHQAARQQKERRKMALAEQKAKEAEQERRRRHQIERIRAEEQQVLEERILKQQQMREATRKQHLKRLMAEKQRQHEALNLISEMEEEERNVRLRLEALQLHRGVMQQELRENSLPPHGGI